MEEALMSSYGQFMSLFSKTVAERTKPGQRQDVEEKGRYLVLAQSSFSQKRIHFMRTAARKAWRGS